jgi:riboflavin synthase alpha subunit
MHRYRFGRTISSFEATQLERAIEPNGGHLIISGHSVTGAVANAADIEPILQQMTDVRVSEL